jgi:threonine/homoserine/homoserine lactone efflux protein
MEIPYAFIVAVILLGLIPGPNVGVIVGLSLAKGWRTGLMAVSGTSAGLAIQLLIVSVVTSSLVDQIANFLFILRWAGVGYLLFLAISALKSASNSRKNKNQKNKFLENSGKSIDGSDELIINSHFSTEGFFEGLFVAIINPKTLLFNAAFLPQFIHIGSGQTVLEQFIILSLFYLLILAAIDCCWVLFANFMKKLLRKYKGHLGMFSAACLFASAAIIATIRR